MNGLSGKTTATGLFFMILGFILGSLITTSIVNDQCTRNNVLHKYGVTKEPDYLLYVHKADNITLKSKDFQYTFDMKDIKDIIKLDKNK
ncbi:MAG TPA: hypothetical protein VF680_16980 [Allosphingosinicella sp.]|jgi:hypothetical protein